MNVSGLDTRHPVFWVHRLGAVAVALILWVFAALGFASGTGFVTVHGARALGMTGNGLLSTISVIVGVILVLAALRGGRAASTTCAVIGALFVLSGLVNLALVDGPYNFLAFTLPNIMFSFVVGIILLFVGLYGRASGQLPVDNPYRRAQGGTNAMTRLWHGESFAQEAPDDPDAAARHLAEITELADAEHAMAEGEATPQQEREVVADATERSSRRRTRAWRQAVRNGWR